MYTNTNTNQFGPYLPIAAGIRLTNENEYLNEAHLRRYAPSLFAEVKAPNTSEKYTFLSSKQVLDTMLNAGFYPVSIQQQRTRDYEKRAYTKHLVRFQNPNLPTIAGVKPEVLYSSAHDGSAAFTFLAGLFRAACFNGLFTGFGFGSIKVRHIGANTGNILDAVKTVSAQFDGVLSKVDTMSTKMLSDNQRFDFATQALAIRWGDKPKPLTESQVLYARRLEDSENSLFKILNRVQENLIKGGRFYSGKVRGVNSINNEISINRQLWDLAESYL